MLQGRGYTSIVDGFAVTATATRNGLVEVIVVVDTLGAAQPSSLTVFPKADAIAIAARAAALPDTSNRTIFFKHP